jgi:hypothetical protein
MQYIPPTLPIANISVANTTHDLVDRVQTIVDYLNENPIEPSANDLNANTAHFLVGNTVTTNSSALSLGANAALYANGSPGANGQVLVSNGTATYWATPDVGDTHGLLSNTHNDTTAAPPIRGDLITAVGASPLWARFPIGLAGYALTSNGTDPAWTASVNSALFANTANNAGYLNGHTEAQLNVNSALSANQANNSSYLNGHTEVQLNVNSALGANNSSYLNGHTEAQLNANSALSANQANNSSYLNGHTEVQLNVNSALGANNAGYLNGHTEVQLNVNSALGANNAGYLNGHTEAQLNVNSALGANNATYAFGKTEGQLNANSALSANVANNATYAFGKTEGQLNANSALSANVANNATYAFTANAALFANAASYLNGHTEAQLNANSALSANVANNATYAFGKLESALNVNSALTSNNTLHIAGWAVNNTGPSNAQVLTWNAAANAWFPEVGGSGGPHAILSSTHTDANVATVQNGDLIMGSGGAGTYNTYSVLYTWVWSDNVESWTGLTPNANDSCVQISNDAITGTGSGATNTSYQWTWPTGSANGWTASSFGVGHMDVIVGPFGSPSDTVAVDGIGASVTFTWENLGVPANSTVTSVALNFNHQRIVSTHLSTPSIDVYLVNGSNTNIITGNGAMAHYGWTVNATDGSPVPYGLTTNTAVQSAYQPSNTSVTLLVAYDVSSQVTKTDATMDLRFSNVILVVNYTSVTGNLAAEYVVTAVGPAMAWTDLGVPANATVITVKLSGLDRKVGTANDIATNTLTLGISPNGNTAQTVLVGTSNLATYALPNTAGSFSTLSAGSNVNIGGAYSSPSASIQMTLGLDVISGSAGGGVIQDEFKNLGLLIYYLLPVGNVVAATWARLPVGATGQVLTSNGTFAAWANAATGPSTPTDDGNSGTSKTIDWSTASKHYLNMTGNCTLTLSNPVDGASYFLIVNSGAGAFVITWPANVKWGLGGQPMNSQTANVTDMFTAIYKASSNIYLMSYNLGY